MHQTAKTPNTPLFIGSYTPGGSRSVGADYSNAPGRTLGTVPAGTAGSYARIGLDDAAGPAPHHRDGDGAVLLCPAAGGIPCAPAPRRTCTRQHGLGGAPHRLDRG